MRRASWMVLPIIALVSIVAPARSLAQSADDVSKFRERETAVWESVKNKQLGPIRRVFDKDYVAVYDAGIIGLADELDGMGKVTLRSYRLSDFRMQRLDNLNMLVAYKVVVDGEMGGESISGTYNNLTVWHRRGNSWSVAAHTEVKAK